MIGNRVADFHVGDSFDVGDEITDVAGLQPRLHKHFRREHAYFLDLVAPVIAHHPNRFIRFHLSRHHPHVTDNAAINVEHGIKHERAQRFVFWFFRRWNPMHDRF